MLKKNNGRSSRYAAHRNIRCAFSFRLFASEKSFGIVVSQSHYSFDLMGRPVLETQQILDGGGENRLANT